MHFQELGPEDGFYLSRSNRVLDAGPEVFHLYPLCCREDGHSSGKGINESLQRWIQPGAYQRLAIAFVDFTIHPRVLWTACARQRLRVHARLVKEIQVGRLARQAARVSEEMNSHRAEIQRRRVLPDALNYIWVLIQVYIDTGEHWYTRNGWFPIVTSPHRGG